MNAHLIDIAYVVAMPLMWVFTYLSYGLRVRTWRLTLIFGLSTACLLLAFASFYFVPDVRLWGSPRGLGDYVGSAATIVVAVVFLIMTANPKGR